LWEHLIQEHAEQLTVVLSAHSLRARQAVLSQSLSWDATIDDLEREFSDGASTDDLGRARRVVVYFADAGVAVYARDGKERMGLERFVYHPEELEGAWRASRPGLTFGAASILTASVARHLVQPLTYPLFVAAGRALAAARSHHDLGGRTSPDAGPPDFLVDSAAHWMGSILHPASDVPAAKMPETEYRCAFSRTRFSSAGPVESKSSLMQAATGRGREYAAATALQVVLHGIDRALDAAPKAHFGAYLTVDREEIERLNEIRRLIQSYCENEVERTPLSLAVFGPPGSGKSFAIKQLAQDIFGRSQAILEFNLSQMGTREELHRAFDQVRDATVKGKIPLVLWDEFDSNEAAWLREFLAPMQDAEYVANGTPHPLGKVIFVFAGGTSSDFRTFDLSGIAGPDGERFRRAKGPDFVSRLRGYVNIKGPNPVVTADGDDIAHLVRRAILLRSVLERYCPHLVHPPTAAGMAAVSASVVRGFLRAQSFRHGARSLEAIVTMSALTNSRHFGVAELPSQELLALHVSPDFMTCVHEGELEDATIEYLAQAGHRAWLTQRLARGWRYGPDFSEEHKTHPLLLDYYVLTDLERERNRHSARVTLAKLQEVGYRVVPTRDRWTGAQPTLAPGPAERRRLMEIEHDIWLRDRFMHGYEWAGETNERLRLHRDIRPFRQLPEEDQDLNGALVDGMLNALREGGYGLVRATQPLRPRVQVGVTGHRILAETDRVLGGVRQALGTIQAAYGNRPLTVLSALAEGADRLVAEAAAQIPESELVAVFPRSREGYAEDFGTEGAPSRLHFDALVDRAAEVLELQTLGNRDEDYQQAGYAIVDRCDVLLAVWDGLDAQGQGGTGDVVKRARALGKPVVIVRAGNQHPQTNEPTSLGQAQGQVVSERLPLA
jgi:hypothetical protein